MIRFRPAGLRARLMLLVTVGVIPVTAAIVYGGVQQRREAAVDVERDALALARSAAAEQDRLVLETRQLLRVLAQVPEVRRADPAECGAFLAAVMAEAERYVNIGVVQPDGLVRCSALPIDAPVDVSSRKWFARALETGRFAVGDYQVGMITHVPSVNFGQPIVEAGGEIGGVVFVALPLSWLQDRLSVGDLAEGSEVLVTTSAGTVLARYPEREGQVGASLAGTPLAEAILADRIDDDPVEEAVGTDGVSRLYATTLLQDLPDEHAVLVSVGIPTELAFAPVNAAVTRNLTILGLALVLVLAATWWTSGALVLRPVRALLLATRRLSDGELGTRATVTGAPSEIEHLAGAFNVMAARLQRHVREIDDHLVQIGRLSRVRAVLTGINRAILRIRERDELLRAACRISVEDGEFAFSWVAEVDPTTREIRVAATSSGGRGEIGPEAGGAVPAALRGRAGLAAAALRQGTEVVSNDLVAETGEEADRARIRELGFRSAAALPLRVDDRVVAALNLYTDEAGFFTDEEIRLMRDLAADTSLGLEYLEKEKRLHYLANYDPLTDLPNRELFGDHLRQAIGRARQEEQLAAVLVIRIDRLAEINATLGSRAGDEVIQSMAGHLREAAGEAGSAGRLGSDHFGVVCPGATDVREVEDFAIELLGYMPRALSSGDEEIFLSSRIGIGVFPHDGADADALIRAGMLALESAASSPANPITFHSPELDAEAQLRRRLELALRAALAREELVLLYQPVVDLETTDPIGMEALVRWHNPDLGDVSPGTFVPLAEEMGIIGEIGEWVLGTAARVGRRLHDEGLTELRMNVNVSVSQIRDERFQERFVRIIEETGIDLGRLGIGIEITESELMENIDDALAALETFRRMGLWIYIDDFGTGYSSLSYLRRLPIDSLKIDQSFVHDIPAPDAVAVVRSIIALAHALDLRVIAEGVETEEQLEVLRELGCDAGQGFLFSQPLHANALETYLSGRV